MRQWTTNGWQLSWWIVGSTLLRGWQFSLGHRCAYEQNHDGPNLAANHRPIIKIWLGHRCTTEKLLSGICGLFSCQRPRSAFKAIFSYFYAYCLRSLCCNRVCCSTGCGAWTEALFLPCSSRLLSSFSLRGFRPTPTAFLSLCKNT